MRGGPGSVRDLHAPRRVLTSRQPTCVVAAGRRRKGVSRHVSLRSSTSCSARVPRNGCGRFERARRRCQVDRERVDTACAPLGGSRGACWRQSRRGGGEPGHSHDLRGKRRREHRFGHQWGDLQCDLTTSGCGRDRGHGDRRQQSARRRRQPGNQHHLRGELRREHGLGDRRCDLQRARTPRVAANTRQR